VLDNWTRGLSEKKIAERVNKTTKKYYELSSDTADHIEILVSEENPKLLKSLREELSVDINLAQNSIHQLLHHMGSSQKIAIKNYLKDLKRYQYQMRSLQKRIILNYQIH